MKRRIFSLIAAATVVAGLGVATSASAHGSVAVSIGIPGFAVGYHNRGIGVGFGVAPLYPAPVYAAPAYTAYYPAAYYAPPYASVYAAPYYAPRPYVRSYYRPYGAYQGAYYGHYYGHYHGPVRVAYRGHR